MTEVAHIIDKTPKTNPGINQLGNSPQHPLRPNGNLYFQTNKTIYHEKHYID